ncbi:MAG: polyphosphate kinase 1 [Chloroflexi bacterium]|uniref:Polyphosphate kinase n=1 Tax=Candidatus Chlorohelix allophototropha TaxID=3003348 RepID=A0A8T7M7J8_9CHLR|nr:polyphosphate kinase 1 [Chloroflexota bacterium]WJW68055.1 polyphosphate kinase 1 [Chloroflexota bacterium L227-S17]
MTRNHPITTDNHQLIEPQKAYFNREISLLEFNYRVLEEAMDETHPLLERVKFLSIFYSNIDEFYMIRVSGLKAQVEEGVTESSEDGLTPREQLLLLRDRVQVLYKLAIRYFKETLLPLLAKAGIHIYNYSELNDEQKTTLKGYFDSTVYPVLTPLAVDPAHPFPHISNLSLSLAVVIKSPDGDNKFARVKIPQVLPRLVPVDVPYDRNQPELIRGRKRGYVWLEQLVAANLDTLFTGLQVVNSYAFRVVRDADIEIRQDEAGDLLQTVEESLARRRFGSVTQLLVDAHTPDSIKSILSSNLEIESDYVYPTEGPLGLADLMSLYELEIPGLKDPPFRPRVPSSLRSGTDIFASIRAHDILLHHPYDSFTPVIDFLNAAANDPDVLAIKQTIYRVGSNSPIVEALAEASLNGKQVSVLVELKARFDEENNIEWARALEKAGVHVVYGDIELKTHCKILLVVRKEPDGIRRYVHLSTGNYNYKTARVYTDIGLFTCQPDLGADASALFNSLTGYSLNTAYRKLLVSPGGIRQGLLERINREIEHVKAGRGGQLIFKVNALTDFKLIDALYEASQAGVSIDLIIRNSCCIIPGVKGLSENIRVISIVGRFLEHHRVFYFRNGDESAEEVWLGSADMMQRNLDRRVETTFPVEDLILKDWLIKEVLASYLKDNQKARLLLPDGAYNHIRPKSGEPAFNAQLWFLRRSQEHDSHSILEENQITRIED